MPLLIELIQQSLFKLLQLFNLFLHIILLLGCGMVTCNLLIINLSGKLTKLDSVLSICRSWCVLMGCLV
jgi:hypothetical protein